MEKAELLKELEQSLKHLMCLGIQEPTRRRQMDGAVEKFVREEAVGYTEQEIRDKFNSTEETFRIFFEYLIAWGLVEVTDEPDH